MVLYATHANSNYTSIITISEISTSIENNTSTLSYLVQMKSKNGYNFESIGSTLILKINGVKVVHDTSQKSCGKNTTVTLASGTTTVKHNDDGKKTINVEYSYSQSSTASYTPKSASESGLMQLSTIARTTKAVTFTGFVEKVNPISFNPASSTFTHSIKLTFGNNVKYLNSEGNLQTTEVKLSGSSFNFNVPVDYYNEFTTESKTGTMLLTTYNGSSSIGTSSITFTIYADKEICKPNLTGTLIDVNGLTSKLTSGNDTSNSIVKGFSTGRLTITSKKISSVNDINATIKSLVIANNNITDTSKNVYDINKLQNKSVDVTLTNSRGVSETFVISATGELIDYIVLTGNAKTKRESPTSNTIVVNLTGNYFNDSFGNVNNSLNIEWSYREKGNESWNNGGTLTPILENNTYSFSNNLEGEFNYQKNYEFKFKISDKLTTLETIQITPKGIETFGIYEDGSLRVNGLFFKVVKVDSWEE